MLVFIPCYPVFLTTLQEQSLDALLDELPVALDNTQRNMLRQQIVRDGIVLWPDLAAALFPGVRKGVHRDHAEILHCYTENIGTERTPIQVPVLTLKRAWRA